MNPGPPKDLQGPASDEEGHLPPPGEGHAVLVVDDEDLLREVVAKQLVQAGYKVVTATNGQEALRKIYTSPDWGPSGFPDLVIADILMPTMDGFELCQRIKGNPRLKPIPLLFLTAKREILDKAKGYMLGCQRYIVKPFTRKQLLQAVNERLVDVEQTRALLDEHDQAFRGDLARSSVHTLVDLFLIGGWTGSVAVQAQSQVGRLEFKSGEIIRAQWGEKEGEEALAELLAQVEGTFQAERSPSALPLSGPS
jgi:twitching motility two-component system response regulator PilG